MGKENTREMMNNHRYKRRNGLSDSFRSSKIRLIEISKVRFDFTDEFT